MLKKDIVTLSQTHTRSHPSESRRDRSRGTKKNELKPWQFKQWCIPAQQNAEFVCRMEDVLDVYTQPYDAKHPLVTMDEKPVQLIGETSRPVKAKPGQLERFDFEYKGNGVANLFMLFEPLAARRQVSVRERKTNKDWAECMRELVEVHYPEAERITLVMDNLSTHKLASLYEVFEASQARRIAQKLEVHYTPKQGSWLNMAEIELSVLSRQCLKRRIASQEALEMAVAAWQKTRNTESAKVDWRFTTADARIKLKRLYPTIHG